jgi:hypothetical protein
MKACSGSVILVCLVALAGCASSDPGKPRVMAPKTKPLSEGTTRSDDYWSRRELEDKYDRAEESRSRPPR